MVAEAMGEEVGGMSEAAAGLSAAMAIEGFIREAGLPTRLRDVGVPEADLSACAEATMFDGAIVYNAKPVVSPGEILRVLKSAW
jgi:alcohol dehydrogenase